MTDRYNATVKRGPDSWAYIQTVLGFVLMIEATVIGSMVPLHFPANIFYFIAVAALTIYGFIKSGWIHNKLMAFKNYYENQDR